MNSFLSRIQKRDVGILMLFNNSIRCNVLNTIMPILTYIGSGIFAVLFCIVTFFNVFTRSLSVKTSLALIVSSIIVRIIKIHVNRLRPYLTLQNLNTKKIGIDNYSFPSGHTTSAFCIAVMLLLNLPSLTVLSILIALCVGISRMYLGVHYPTDVFAGILIGSATSLVLFGLF